jgi:hypothetical protein
MRLFGLFFSVLLGAIVMAGQEPARCPSLPPIDDRYSVTAVSAALKFTQRGGNSIEAKGYAWPILALGDRASIATLKIYTPEELVQAQNANAYLTMVRNAFSSRNSVSEKSDTDPKVTLFVLAFLKEREVSSPEIERSIEYLQGCVPAFTCSSRGAYEFEKNR